MVIDSTIPHTVLPTHAQINASVTEKLTGFIINQRVLNFSYFSFKYKFETFLLCPIGLWCWLPSDSVSWSPVLALFRVSQLDCCPRREVAADSWLLWFHSSQRVEHLRSLPQKFIKVYHINTSSGGYKISTCRGISVFYMIQPK